MTHHVDLTTIKLHSGSHTRKQADKGEACLLEWTSIFAGVDYGDHPVCTSPVLAEFGISFNDRLDDERRQRLIPFIPRLVGTAGDARADEIRAWMATDWLVRTFTPAWLRKAGLADRAAELAALPELTSAEFATSGMAVIERARSEAAAARATATACAAAGAAAWDATAWDAAGVAAWDATAWDAARATATAWAAAGAAAWDATAWDAARDAYSKAKRDKYGAAYKAARAILIEEFAETNVELFESALVLFDRMIDARSAVPS